MSHPGLLKNSIIVTTVIITHLIIADYSPAQTKRALPNNVERANLKNERGLKLDSAYLKGYLKDTEYIIKAPLRWRRKEWVKASIVVGIIAGLYGIDSDIKRWSQENRTATTDDIARIAKVFGDFRYTLPPIALLYLYGHHYNNSRAQRTALLGTESLVISGLFTEAIKLSSRRHRPDNGNALSFPSGHSTSAFAIATVIAREYSDYTFMPPIAYGIATLTALSRVNDNAHWISDVFFGSAIGYLSASSIISRKMDDRFALIPVRGENYQALLLSYRF